MSESDYEAQMRKIFGEHAEEALALYSVSDPKDMDAALSRMLTEIGFASTARFAARSMSRTDSPTYLYQFTSVPLDNPLGAFHAVEIPYVFGNADLFSTLGNIEQADHDLSDSSHGLLDTIRSHRRPQRRRCPDVAQVRGGLRSAPGAGRHASAPVPASTGRPATWPTG